MREQVVQLTHLLLADTVKALKHHHLQSNPSNPMRNADTEQTILFLLKT